MHPTVNISLVLSVPPSRCVASFSSHGWQRRQCQRDSRHPLVEAAAPQTSSASLANPRNALRCPASTTPPLSHPCLQRASSLPHTLSSYQPGPSLRCRLYLALSVHTTGDRAYLRRYASTCPHHCQQSKVHPWVCNGNAASSAVLVRTSN